MVCSSNKFVAGKQLKPMRIVDQSMDTKKFGERNGNKERKTVKEKKEES